MNVSPSAYYAWRKQPAKLITAYDLHLYHRTKALFVASRESLGSRELMKKLRAEGLQIGRYKTRSLMQRLNLVVKQRIEYKMTTKRKHSDAGADNLINQNFTLLAVNLCQRYIIKSTASFIFKSFIPPPVRR